MIELTIRLIGSLAVVVGLLLVTVRIAGRKFRPGAGAPVRILHRQALSRSTSVAVVEVGGRVLVLGATEHQISVLTELDPAEAAAAQATGELLELPRTADLSGADFPALVLAHDAEPVAPRHSAPRGRHAAKPTPRAAARSIAKPSADPGARATGPLAGSVLSVQTWRQAFSAATERS